MREPGLPGLEAHAEERMAHDTDTTEGLSPTILQRSHLLLLESFLVAEEGDERDVRTHLDLAA